MLADAVFDGDGLGAASPRCATPAARIAGGDRANSTMGNRDCPFLLQLVGAASEVETMRAAKDALDLPGRTYLNFLEGDERRHGARTSIDADDLAGIVALRRRLDPDDVLRFGVEHS